MSTSIAELRRDYRLRALTEEEAGTDPFLLFEQWLQEAIRSQLPDPTGATLATASREGRPSGRIVLLKEFDENGFVFYTSYISDKGRQLAENAFASLIFWWAELERQVRIEGETRQTAGPEADAYFRSRPRESQLGAWASRQSEVLRNRAELEERVRDLQVEYENQEIPRPPHWGGYRLVPDSIEFWQGRPSRLHDRLRYHREEEHRWKIQRLAP